MLEETLSRIGPLDDGAVAAARALHTRLTKPAGSLGALEALSVRLAGLAGTCPPPLLERPALAIFAGDHGVHAQGVTPWPPEVTAQMVANFLAGGAVVNAFARQVGADVTVVDVGVLTELEGEGLLNRKVRAGTRDLSIEPAMTHAEALQAIGVGIEVADRLIDGGAGSPEARQGDPSAGSVSAGANVLLTGDMGIANTTPAAALIAAFTGADPHAVTGLGTGIDSETHARKVAVVTTAVVALEADDPVGILAAVGGLEHAALAGFILEAAARRVPVILDGVIAAAAALVAHALAPHAVHAMVAGHRSAEPGATVALSYLGLEPLIDLGLRLGEGTGAALALPLVAGSVRILHEVATFDAAGVAKKE